MIQQINLYQAEFRTVRNWTNLLLLAAGVLIVLVLVGGGIYQTSVINELESELASRNNELKSLEQTFTTLEKNIQPRAMDMNLAVQVEKIRRSNEEKRRAKNFLSGDGAGNNSGFSALLQGLGRQRDEIEDLWLKNIQFTEGGFDMRLTGSHYRPELLPEFIQALNDEDLYRDREFREIKINRSAVDNKVMDFVLATRAGADKPATDRDLSEQMLFMARLKQLLEKQDER